MYTKFVSRIRYNSTSNCKSGNQNRDNSASVGAIEGVTLTFETNKEEISSGKEHI